MKFTNENQTLTLFLEGELNSYNSEEVEKEIESIMNKNSFKKVVIDMGDLTYISSAGLRILVRIKQQYNDTSIIKVSSDVYDVLEMVGFDNLFKIQQL